MISVTNKKMVGNIGTAQIWLPYAYYQAKRLELDMDKLGQTVGYRNLVLDDDSRVYLFAKDGVMNITVEGAGFNPHQPDRVPPGDWVAPVDDEEIVTPGTMFYCVAYKPVGEKIILRKIPILYAGGENGNAVLGGTPTDDHICPKRSCGFFKRKSNAITTKQLVRERPAFGYVASIDYEQLLLWGHITQIDNDYNVSVSSGIWGPYPCSYGNMVQTAGWTKETATVSYIFSGGSIRYLADQEVGWASAGSGESDYLYSNEFVGCNWAIDSFWNGGYTVGTGLMASAFVVVDDSMDNIVGNPLRLQADTNELYNVGGTHGSIGSGTWSDITRIRLFAHGSPLIYDRIFKSSFSGPVGGITLPVDSTYYSGYLFSGASLLDAIVHTGRLTAVLFTINYTDFRERKYVEETWLVWDWDNGNGGIVLVESNYRGTIGGVEGKRPIESSVRFCYSEDYFAFIGRFTDVSTSQLYLRSGVVSRTTNKLTTWNPTFPVDSTGEVNLGFA